MLTSTFCCFRGVSPAAERRLWQAGCGSWRDLLLLDQPTFSSSKLRDVRDQIPAAEAALEAGMADYFLNRLPGGAKLRVLPHFLEGVGYLDIETTGLGRSDQVTVIGLLARGQLTTHLRGRRLEGVLRAIAGLHLLVTYNGTQFDLPRLRRALGIDLATPHLDLKPCLSALGLRGGAKACEERLGVGGRHERHLVGADAPSLWEKYEKQGDEGALLRLIRYNAEDVLALERMAVRAYNLETTGMPNAFRLPPPVQPRLPDLAA